MPKPHASETRPARPVSSHEDYDSYDEESVDNGHAASIPANETKNLSVNYRGHRKAPPSAAVKRNEPVPALLELNVQAKVHAYILHEDDDDETSGSADASLEHLCKLKELPTEEGVVHPPHTFRYGAAEVTALLDAPDDPFHIALLIEGTGSTPKPLSVVQKRLLAEMRRDAAEKELGGPQRASTSLRRWSATSSRSFQRSGSSLSASGATQTKSQRQSTLNELFDTLDADHDGTLTRDEVVANAEKLGMTPEEAANLFDDLDDDQSGELTRSEFSVLDGLSSFFNLPTSIWSANNAANTGDTEAEKVRKAKAKAAAKNKRRSRPSSTVHELFRLLDTNGDGVLTLDEVVDAHEKLGLTADQAMKLFEGLDVDGSGTLTRAEMSFMGSLTQKIKSASRLSFSPKPVLQAENINEDSSHDALNHGDHGHRKPVPTPKKRMRRLSVNQLFDLLDADGDGTLVLSEVVDAANKLGVTQEEAAHLFHDLDKDGSGTLTRDELSTIESFSHYFSKGPRFSLTRRSSGSSIPDESNSSNRFGDDDFKATKGSTSKGKQKQLTVNELFDIIDTNGDGYLIRSEVVGAASKLGLTKEEAASLFHELDKDGSGTLTRKELGAFEKMGQYFKMPTFGFTSSTSEKAAGKKKPHARKKRRPTLNELFDIIDTNGDGYLIRSEVVGAASKLGLTKEEAASLFHELDKDGSGTLTRKELSTMGKMARFMYGQLPSLSSMSSSRKGSREQPNGLEPGSSGRSLAQRHSQAVRKLVANRTLTASDKIAQLTDMRDRGLAAELGENGRPSPTSTSSSTSTDNNLSDSLAAAVAPQGYSENDFTADCALVLAAPELCCSDTDESDVPSPPSPRKAGSVGTNSSSAGLRKRPDASLSPQSGRHGARAKKGERRRAAEHVGEDESSVGSDESKYRAARARAAAEEEEDRLAAEEEAWRETKEQRDEMRMRKEAAEKEKQQRERELELARKFTAENEVGSEGFRNVASHRGSCLWYHSRSHQDLAHKMPGVPFHGVIYPVADQRDESGPQPDEQGWFACDVFGGGQFYQCLWDPNGEVVFRDEAACKRDERAAKATKRRSEAHPPASPASNNPSGSARRRPSRASRSPVRQSPLHGESTSQEQPNHSTFDQSCEDAHRGSSPSKRRDSHQRPKPTRRGTGTSSSSQGSAAASVSRDSPPAHAHRQAGPSPVGTSRYTINGEEEDS